MRRVRLEFRFGSGESGFEACVVHDEHGPELILTRGASLFERREVVTLDYERYGPRVRQEVFDLIRRQTRVHHYDGRADLETSEQGGDVFWNVGQGDHHPLLGLNADVSQHIPEPVCRLLHLGVSERRMIGQDRGAFALSLSEAILQEILGDVEALGRRERHGVSSGSGMSCHDLTQPLE